MSGKKFVKVLSVKQSYELEDKGFITNAVPNRVVARVVDTKGKVDVIRTSDFLNVGDEIDIVEETVKEFTTYGFLAPETLATVVKNYTQQKMINDFVAKNKTKRR